MSFVITVYNVVQIFYTLASLKMILTAGRYVCDIHKEKKKATTHIYPAQIFIHGRSSNIRCLPSREISVSETGR